MNRIAFTAAGALAGVYLLSGVLAFALLAVLAWMVERVLR